MNRVRVWFAVWVVCAAATSSAAQDNVAAPTPVGPQEIATSEDDTLLIYLTARARKNPQHSDTWRLLGNRQTALRNPLAALDALERALELDPHNAAAHHDLGRVLQSIGDNVGADHHFRQCVICAPRSDYASSLREAGLVQLPEPLNSDRATNQASNVANLGTNDRATERNDSLEAATIGYRIQTFDGADDSERRLDQLRSDATPPLKRLRLFVESGLLYNSNVSLTPISRELANVKAESLQALFNPELEWIALHRDTIRAGTIGRSFLTVNESDKSSLNLSSVQPGLFVERDFLWKDCELIARIEYLYALDLLGSSRLGDRHSATASLITISPDLKVTYAYVTASNSQFRDDGFNPGSDSLDGPSVTGGLTRFYRTPISWLPTYNLGLDLETASTEGSDFRYRAVTGHGETTVAFRSNWQWLTSWGVGYRDYYSFSGPVNRDQLTWRLQAKLRWQYNDPIAFALFAGHDRFASDNVEFDAERTQGGLLMTLLL